MAKAKTKLERPLPPVMPKVGDGITYHIGSDSYPGTISWVSKTGLMFRYRLDNHTWIGGSVSGGNAMYNYTPNPQAEEVEVRWTVRNGVGNYRKTGQRSGYISVGSRSLYQDRER